MMLIVVLVLLLSLPIHGLDLKPTYNSNGLLDKIAYEDLTFTDATRVDSPTIFSSKKLKKRQLGKGIINTAFIFYIQPQKTSVALHKLGDNEA